MAPTAEAGRATRDLDAGVLLSGDEGEVVGAHAPPSVAPMVHAHLGRDWTVLALPGDAVRTELSAAPRHDPIPAGIKRSQPHVAVLGAMNFRFESIHVWLSATAASNSNPSGWRTAITNYDPEFGMTVLNDTDVDSSEVFRSLADQNPEVAALVRWSNDTRLPQSRRAGLFERDRYATREFP